ncbi:CPBP family intramembrane glutamic endopeptidase [Halodesulfurarchaeum sp.]|uniref:CPBP family intramembrane glutamic endopeptidase n=1 Tax=Halodesulfurarchaeum sp. TaxID=1980530 RepID=UPI001BB8A803|nr:CPBP family intramembrane metalloprotease [Halodesulfurarchaeum sp.]
MAAPAWDLFVLFSVTLALAVVVLARRTARLVTIETGPLAQLSRSALYLNVVVSHGLVLGLIGVVIWWTGVPLKPLGIEMVPEWAWLVGVAGALIVLNEAAARVTSNFETAENQLRDLLTPATGPEWVVLLGLLLPTIAITEELLFRGVLIGAFAVATPVPTGFLIVGSAILFGGAHTAQGWLGMGIATLLGVALGAAYVWTGSLWLVIGAHYLIDLVEFVSHVPGKTKPAESEPGPNEPLT